MKPPATSTATAPAPDQAGLLEQLAQQLLAQHGEAQQARIRQGLQQVLQRWQDGDGDAAELAKLVSTHFIADPAALNDTAARLELALEMLDGHIYQAEMEISRFQELDIGPVRPIDGLLAAYSPSSHINDDLFKNKVAFVVLLNFPLFTLEERLKGGLGWSREQWARARLAGRFEHRLPADILMAIEQQNSAAEQYIDSYNVYLDRLAGPSGSAGFPAGKKLISHWGLRDEIRALYGNTKDGLRQQRLIARVMERIIRQEIPAAVVDKNELEWDPEQNLVRTPGAKEWQKAEREPDVRYERLLAVFHAQQKADPFYPALPTHIDRTFSLGREIPEKRVRQLLESVLESEAAKGVAKLMAQRLGRPLEPFDLWYAGFRPLNAVDEGTLDQITRKRYPTPKAFQDDLPRILGKLGFVDETVRFLTDHIVVDPSRGAGHASGAKRRDDKAHLRTRVGKDGMDYKGFNIAVHELGHNVEQVFSMSRIDHTLLEGVPNTGFTEAFAFLFQARDLELLEQAPPADKTAVAIRNLDRFWQTYEIAGVGILDLEIWHWLYDHPEASPAELREATVTIAKDVWNRYYAAVFGVRDVILPAIYSHIIAYGLYTPDYSLGFLITAQVEAYLRSHKLAVEMERMCRLGRLAPDVWMKQAVGSEITSAALLQATGEALTIITK